MRIADCGLRILKEGRPAIFDCGLRPPASPSCRLALRAGSRRGHKGLRPGGIANCDGNEDSLFVLAPAAEIEKEI
ncbi:hypothetical protein JY97_03265 [Alkalispirochaeta odontotermitis]|nr:hypothetical protein JY97_03265 [Alkalispirochaeta odontotermitis]